MSIDTTMAVLYAQTGMATQVANAAAVAPQASLAMSRVLAAEMARQKQQQIEKTESAENAKLDLAPDGQGGGGYFGSRRRKRMYTPDDEPRQSISPFVGNFLNVKV